MQKGYELNNELDIQSIGQRIKQLCYQRRISYQELADKAGISLAALYNLMSGKGNPRLSTLQLISKGLGVTLGGLLSYELYNTDFAVSDKELMRMVAGLSMEKKRLLKMYLDLLSL